MYIFNRITVNPQLPKRIEKLSEDWIQSLVVMEYRVFKII